MKTKTNTSIFILIIFFQLLISNFSYCQSVFADTIKDSNKLDTTKKQLSIDKKITVIDTILYESENDSIKAASNTELISNAFKKDSSKIIQVEQVEDLTNHFPTNCDTLYCSVNGKIEKITCKQYRYVLNLHWKKKLLLDSINIKIKELESQLLVANDEIKRHYRKTSKLISSEINGINNLPIDVYYNEKSYSVYIVNPKSNKIQLFNQLDNKNIHSFVTIRNLLEDKGQFLLFAMNAGMYDTNQLPIGLYIEAGKEMHPINLKISSPQPSNFYDLQPNGVFALNNYNEAFIIESHKYKTLNKKNIIKLATQSGPLMLSNGTINSHFRKGSKNLNIRNGIGVNNSGNVVFVISNEAVNFYEFSELFRDILDCQNALYLDGVVSKMFLPELDKIDLTNSSHLGPIITVVK